MVEQELPPDQRLRQPDRDAIALETETPQQTGHVDDERFEQGFAAEFAQRRRRQFFAVTDDQQVVSEDVGVVLVGRGEQALESRGVIPVVAVERCDEATARTAQRVIARLADAHILFVLEHLDSRIGRRVFLRDCEGLVGRSIVDDHEFPRAQCLRLH